MIFYDGSHYIGWWDLIPQMEAIKWVTRDGSNTEDLAKIKYAY